MRRRMQKGERIMLKHTGRLTALLALTLLCTACSVGSSPFSPAESSRTVRISVSTSSDSVEREGIRLFVDQLIENSDTPLDVSLFYEDDPEASLLAGEADIIYIDSATLAAHESDFAIYASPYYFEDYTHMTMVLNSPTFLGLTKEDYIESLSARQLGAFYGGTMMLLTKENPIRAIPDMEEFTLAPLSDNYTEQTLGSLFGDVVLDTSSPLTAWTDERVTAVEVNSALLGEMESAEVGRAYLINTSHRVEVDWLFVSDDFYIASNENLQAALREAAAYAVAYVDDARQTAYEEAYTALQERGVRSARFVTDNLRRTGKELLTSETDFYEQVDRSRYDSISMIIR